MINDTEGTGDEDTTQENPQDTRWKELEEHPELATASHDDMNNFFMRTCPDYGAREYAALLETMDKVHVACIDITEIDMYSAKRLMNTNKQFFDDIDAIIKELNIDPATIQEATDKRRGGGKEGMENLNAILLPVYLKMREKGYSHADLVR